MMITTTSYPLTSIASLDKTVDFFPDKEDKTYKLIKLSELLDAQRCDKKGLTSKEWAQLHVEVAYRLKNIENKLFMEILRNASQFVIEDFEKSSQESLFNKLKNSQISSNRVPTS